MNNTEKANKRLKQIEAAAFRNNATVVNHPNYRIRVKYLVGSVGEDYHYWVLENNAYRMFNRNEVLSIIEENITEFDHLIDM
jgi:hypothetical protein